MTGTTQPATVGPTPAEQVRSILARAATALVRWPDGTTREVRRVVLEAARPAAGAAVTRGRVEVADPAPLPVPDRIRARALLDGAATLTRDGTLRLSPTTVTLGTGSAPAPGRGSTRVPVTDLLLAPPDPLSRLEGGLLAHLDAAHPELVDGLGPLVPAEVLQGAVRVWPLLLDRYGLVLRVERVRGHHDLRLRFTTPADTPEAVRREVELLLRTAHARRAACRGRGLLADLRQAGPYARRLVDPRAPEA